MFGVALLSGRRSGCVGVPAVIGMGLRQLWCNRDQDYGGLSV